MLNESVFEKIIQHFQIHPQMNFFASRLIKQLPVFASYGSESPRSHVHDCSQLKMENRML